MIIKSHLKHFLDLTEAQNVKGCTEYENDPTKYEKYCVISRKILNFGDNVSGNHPE